MPLTSAITPYNESWPDLFRQEAARLRPVFGGACLDFEHVGSTAVEGLSAKAEIDMLVIVSSSKDLNEWEDALRLLGYRRGGDLSLNHHFFKRDFNDVRTHKLHICGSGHAIVRKMISLRD
ncbi:MAG: GrpB family protein, partial [Pseudomonadota bacterium]